MSRSPEDFGGLSIQQRSREGIELQVLGGDMLDGTPILDIKPYLSRPKATPWMASRS